MRRRYRRVPWTGAVLFGTIMLGLAGCTGDDGGNPGSAAGTPGTSTATPAPAVTPGARATTFPIPGSPQPQPVPVIKTVTGSGWSLSLNKVTRISPESVLVEATLTNTRDRELFKNFEEAGFVLRENRETGKLDSTNEFSAVAITAPGDPKQYLPLRDENGVCACTYGFTVGLDRNVPLPVYVYMSAPPGDTINVTVRGFPAFTGVRVQR
jgi:hypothetical protein